jgi:hypothetical protein
MEITKSNSFVLMKSNSKGLTPIELIVATSILSDPERNGSTDARVTIKREREPASTGTLGDA